MLKINWFGATYYGDKLQYKRPVWVAFKMRCAGYWWKVWGMHYVPDGKGSWLKHKLCYKKHYK